MLQNVCWPGLSSKKPEKNFNKKVQDCIDKGYLVEPKDYNGDLEGEPWCYQPYSFALKDEEKLLLGAMERSPEDEQPVRSPKCP